MQDPYGSESNPGKIALDHADYTAFTRQHELNHTDRRDYTDHTDHTDREDVCPVLSR